MSRFKLKLYPSTSRVGKDKSKVTVTEKLDGSNLGFFKVDGDLWIAQRNWVIPFSNLEDSKDFMYKGLYGWLKEHGEELRDSLHENSGVFGEWIGMGSIKYGDTDINGRYYIFAKANLDDKKQQAINIRYEHGLFKYPFIDQVIPEYMNVVPIVTEFDSYPSVNQLDELYEVYVNSDRIADRNVEGFIVIDKGAITKYVRFKGGVLNDHYVGKQR